MKNQKFILGVFFILSASSANAQLDLLAFAGKAAVQVTESAVLGVCFVTNLNKTDIRDAFFSVIFNGNDPNVTQCTLGCAITGLYEGKTVVQTLTGIDLTQFASNIIGPDLYSIANDCLNVTKNTKCDFINSYGSCAVNEAIALVKKDVDGVLTNVLGQVKNIVTNFLNSVGTNLPIIQPLIQPIQQLVNIFFSLASTMIQNSLNSQIQATTVNPIIQGLQEIGNALFNNNQNSNSNNFNLLDILFPKATTATTAKTTVKIANITAVPTATAVTLKTTAKTTENPIQSFFDAVLKNVPIIG